MVLGPGQLCDACFNDRAAALTGWPRLPHPPPPMVVTGPDGRTRELRFRILRAPTGVEVKLEETGVAPGEGYEFAVLGDHDADVDPLIDEVRRIAEGEVARQYLEPATHHRGWTVTDGDEVVGRFVWSDEAVAGAPFDVVVDGRTLTWEEFGVALGSYEGWNFRLLIEDSVVEARTDADVIDIRLRRTGRRPPHG